MSSLLSIVPLDDVNALSVLTYAVATVGVSHVIVAGHTHCGGVEYCYDNAAALPNPPPNPLPPLPDPILNTWLGDLYALAVDLLHSDSTSSPAKRESGSSAPAPESEKGLAKLTKANVRMQVENVAGLDMVKDAWRKGRDLRVVGWLYRLETGRLEDLGICAGPLGTVGCGL